ncbi:hypothetical protein ACFQT0_31270 [Hymenobacter humi]|uniref:Type II toxin-antitoxin system Phd/YefM family antitoxin n=1 Tax=Hymenobacter humi TaxID=1411620 RepID=A0ABW2UG40_9BACT
MNNALQRLAAFRHAEYQALVVQCGPPEELAVLQGGRCVATVPLRPGEWEAIRRALPAPHHLQSLEAFRRALQGPPARS